MSEQLKQLDAGVKIGNKFEYFNLGDVTIQSLAKAGIIPKKDYGDYNIKRPDGLLVDRSNKKNPKVIAIVEYKSTKKFKTERDIQEAIKQCNDYAQVLGAIFGVATDTNVSAWINPKQENKENEYIDSFGVVRSFSFIKDEEKQRLSNNFYLHLQKIHETNFEKLSDEVKETLKVIQRILDSDIGKDNSQLKDTIFVDPTNLAKSVWQDIYVATGKEPEKCLYNVVEIFIFKFLSDLGVLRDNYSFGHLIKMLPVSRNIKNISQKECEDILKHYAKIIRPEIKTVLFPADIEDGTTIMNGTIFVNEKSDPVLEFASLFVKSLMRYDDFGDLTNVEKAFKTKLYETFLKRDSGVKGMGQFFTPRKVIGNIVEMAKVENLKSGARVCDPFCGVGGFPLEVMANRKNKDFLIKNGRIIENIEYFGFDKGSSEKDSERTIILAKANMLIYLSDLIKNNSTITEEFSRIFNKTFKLKKGILGTLADIEDNEENKYDLIITNPPYVTKGSSILKQEIEKNGDISDFYKISGTGVESLAIEWIVNKLKKGGKAFVVVPDGILLRNSEKTLREFILKECFLNGIISLPNKTFFTTNQKTFILALTKKDSENQKQISPIFTYLVSDIGEELDVNRFDTGKSDLETAKNLFRMFDGNETHFKTEDKRCKIQNISKFESEKNWIIDKWWSVEEKVQLGIENEKVSIELNDFKTLSSEAKDNYFEIIKNFDIQNIDSNYKDFQVGGEVGIFEVRKGKSDYTKSFINENKGTFPVYSSQTSNDGIIGNIDTYDFDHECLTWTTDGTYVGTVFYRNNKFSMTSHCGALFLKEKYKGKVYLPYVRIILNQELPNYREGEGSNKRLGSNLIKNIFVKFPVNKNGEFNIEAQKTIFNNFQKAERLKKDIENIFGDLFNNNIVI
ncbi:MAG: N-6 DNA methylase [Candidatus Gracilibacteria bacterium]|nr:N-6 DNA methylase [Candidatus Gracilibacteria bacterium]